MAQYRDAAERYVTSLKTEGCTAISLQGPSDLDFILEWVCMKNGILNTLLPTELLHFHRQKFDFGRRVF
ncbi:MAG: hypothetical protein DRZ90_16680 [Spirochaetes bacterium]|nr:MAG: hypothetical protein DRZ90_16680 [Spirochaetota bacterium]